MVREKFLSESFDWLHTRSTLLPSLPPPQQPGVPLLGVPKRRLRAGRAPVRRGVPEGGRGGGREEDWLIEYLSIEYLRIHIL